MDHHDSGCRRLYHGTCTLNLLRRHLPDLLVGRLVLDGYPKLPVPERQEKAKGMKAGDEPAGLLVALGALAREAGTAMALDTAMQLFTRLHRGRTFRTFNSKYVEASFDGDMEGLGPLGRQCPF